MSYVFVYLLFTKETSKMISSILSYNSGYQLIISII